MSTIYETIIKLYAPLAEERGAEEACGEHHYFSTEPMGQGAVAIGQLAASYGLRAELLTHEHDIIAGDPAQLAAAQLDASMRRTLGIIDGAKPDPDDARMNEMERAIRNQGRELRLVAEMLTKLTTMLTSAPVAASQPVQTVYQSPVQLPIVEPAQLSPQQMAATQKGYPLVGTPPEIPPGMDPTQPMNTRTRGAGRTPEMAASSFQLAGPPATAGIEQIVLDPDGKPRMVKGELPKVGTTLHAPFSDIRVTGG